MGTMLTAANPHESRARARKSFKIARVVVRACREAGLTVAAVEHASASEREAAARIAGTRPPSDETWQVVVGLVDAWLAEDARGD